MKPLDFEKPLTELYAQIEQLKELSQQSNLDLSAEIVKIEKRAHQLKIDIFSNLTPLQIIQIARHQHRPDSLSLIKLIFTDFVELHGDRLFGDDPAIVSGLAKLSGQSIAVIGHQKGHDTKENIKRNFGMANPEGYRKALRIMKLADRFNLPIITFIDTKGAYPGIEAEERGQAEAIAKNLQEMANITVPIISIVIGEGGSGGALGIGVSNKIFMMEYSVYSVISPEGCASILFRDAQKADIAAKNLKITAADIKQLGISDGTIKEPLGGAHTDWNLTAANIKEFIQKELDQYKTIQDKSKIKEERYNKFRNMGFYSAKATV
jgi:acetyl-CoA carboxylase carboxyl transferase subunit alpha